MTTSVHEPSIGTRPLCTAHAPSAIVPCPQAVEKPSLCQNSTPKCAPSSSGGSDHAAVHVGMAARLETQQPAQPVDLGIGDRVHPPIGDRGAGNLDRRVGDDPERLAAGVVVDGANPHEPAASVTERRTRSTSRCRSAARPRTSTPPRPGTDRGRSRRPAPDRGAAGSTLDPSWTSRTMPSGLCRSRSSIGALPCRIALVTSSLAASSRSQLVSGETPHSREHRGSRPARRADGLPGRLRRCRDLGAPAALPGGRELRRRAAPRRRPVRRAAARPRARSASPRSARSGLAARARACRCRRRCCCRDARPGRRCRASAVAPSGSGTVSNSVTGYPVPSGGPPAVSRRAGSPGSRSRGGRCPALL